MRGAWRSWLAACGVIALTAPALAQPKKQPLHPPAVAVPVAVPDPPVTVTVLPASAVPDTAILGALVSSGTGFTWGAAGAEVSGGWVVKLASLTPTGGVCSGLPQVSFTSSVSRMRTVWPAGRLAAGRNVNVRDWLLKVPEPATGVPPVTSPPLSVPPV